MPFNHPIASNISFSIILKDKIKTEVYSAGAMRTSPMRWFLVRFFLTFLGLGLHLCHFQVIWKNIRLIRQTVMVNTGSLRIRRPGLNSAFRQPRIPILSVLPEATSLPSSIGRYG